MSRRHSSDPSLMAPVFVRESDSSSADLTRPSAPEPRCDLEREQFDACAFVQAVR